MLARDAFNETCNMICRKYGKYGFKYIKSRKKISAKINGCTIKLCASTSRDNISDCFVVFSISATLMHGDDKLFWLGSDYIRKDDLYGETVWAEMPEYFELRQMPARDFIGGRLCHWNVALPELREQAVDDVTEWLDRSFFANEKVIEALGVKIVRV